MFVYLFLLRLTLMSTVSVCQLLQAVVPLTFWSRSGTDPEGTAGDRVL